jgi:2-desacetyl-2-hydroxyethyl bacteriochlorophyllide A dehydrogenase
MLAAIFYPDGPKLEERPEPTPGAGDALVQVEYCGICGSDLHAAEPDFKTGTIMGHEFVGTILEVGAEVRDFRAGDRVSVNPNGAVCGHCEFCRSGRANLCADVWKYSVGVARDGGLAPLAAVDQRTLYQVPEGASFRHAALVEPLAVALRAVRSSGIKVGDTAVVFGGGPIGLLATALLRAGGATDISVVEPSSVRREKAVLLGADRAVDPAAGPLVDLLPGKAPQFGFDATGVPEVVKDAVGVLAPGGTLTISGWSKRLPMFAAQDLIFKEITLRGSFIYTTEFDQALAMIATGGIDVEPLISGVLPVSEVPEAFAAMGNSPEVTKLLISDLHAATAES